MRMVQKKYSQIEVDLKQLCEELRDFKEEVIRFMKSYREESQKMNESIMSLEKRRDIDIIWERAKSISLAVLIAITGALSTYIFLR